MSINRKRSQLNSWREMMSNWDEVIQRTPSLVQETIRCGIPSPLRGYLWMSLTSATILKHNHRGLYTQCLNARGSGNNSESDVEFNGTKESVPAITKTNNISNNSNNGDNDSIANNTNTTTTTTPSSQRPALRSTTPNNVRETREETISRDVGRTFPKHQQFRDSGGLGQRSLYHVLRAYSVLDPTVGYCQGMGYIVALLLTTMCEESAFWTLVSLMQSTKYSMSGLFRTGLPRLQLYQHMLEQLLRERQQETAEHLFDQLGVLPSSFAPQWIMTIFTSSFPLESAMRVWDVFLNEGWPYIFQVMMAMMKLASPQLLAMSNFEDALKLLCDDFPRSKNFNILLETSFQIQITDDEFTKLEEQSVNTLVKEYEMERSEMKPELGTRDSVYMIEQ